jgi:hypothetical protein
MREGESVDCVWEVCASVCLFTCVCICVSARCSPSAPSLTPILILPASHLLSAPLHALQYRPTLLSSVLIPLLPPSPLSSPHPSPYYSLSLSAPSPLSLFSLLFPSVPGQAGSSAAHSGECSTVRDRLLLRTYKGLAVQSTFAHTQHYRARTVQYSTIGLNVTPSKSLTNPSSLPPFFPSSLPLPPRGR